MKYREPNTPGSKSVWAYAYQIVPPQPAERLQAIASLLDRQRRLARGVAGSWEGRLVAEEHVTHILVVSDSPSQDLEINHRVEAALRHLKAPFSITAPMAVGGEPTPTSDAS